MLVLTFDRRRRELTRKALAGVSLALFVGSMVALFVLAVLT